MPVNLLQYSEGDIDLGFKSPVDPSISMLTEQAPFSDMYVYGGKSGFIPKYPTYLPSRDNEDYFAQQQNWWDKLSNSAGQFATLAGQTFGNHFTQYGREINSLANGDFSKLWNTEGGERTAEIIELSSAKFPIYQSRAERERREKSKGLLGALGAYIPGTAGAGSSWARLGGQIGFTAGTIGAVVAENVALATTTGGIGNIAKAPATASNAVKSFWYLARAGKTFDTTKDMSRLTVGAKNVGVTYRMFHAASGEAHIEGNLAEREYVRGQIEAFEEQNGYTPPQEIVDKIRQDAVKVGNVTFGWNIPVLMASNAVTIGNLFTRTSLAGAAYREVAKDIIAKNGAVKTLKEVAMASPKLEKAFYLGKAGLKKIQEPLGEGSEELLQGIGSSSAQLLYDNYKSDYAKDTTGFMAIVGKQAAEALNSREGWDEFVAGALTGVGIKGFNALMSRGESAKRQAAVESAKQELQSAIGVLNQVALTDAMKRQADPKKPENDNLTTQAMTAYGIQEAANNNDEKKAQDLRDQAKNKFYSTMHKYGKAEEVIDMYADALREMQEQNKSQFDEMMGNRSIDDVVTELKTEAKDWSETANKVDKKFRNPYNINKEYENHVAYEKAKEVLTGYYMTGKQSFKRAQDLATDLKNRQVNAEVIEAIADPALLGQSIANIESFINIAKDNLKLAQTEGERDALKQQIAQQKTVLKALKEVEKSSAGNEYNIASRIENALGKRDETALPEDLRRDIADLLRLEHEGRMFRTLYNKLLEPKAFESFWEGFQKVAKANDTLKPTEVKTPETPTELTKVGETATLNEEEFENEVEEITFKDGVGVKVVTADILAYLAEEDAKITETAGGFGYNGKVYATREEAHDAILNSSPDASRLSAPTPSGTLGAAIKKRFNAIRKQPPAEVKEPAEVLQEAVSAPTVVSTQSLNPPKTKEVVAKESNNGFTATGSGTTMLHFFDQVIAQVWNSFSYLETQLTNSKDPKHKTIVVKIQDAFKEFANEAQITTIYHYGEKNIEKLDNERIKVFSDGIRFFIITKGKNNATNTIQEELGLHIEDSGSVVIVKQGNQEGTSITSDYELSSSKEESKEAIASLKPGDQLNVRVVDNDFNRALLAEKAEGWEDQLIVEMYYVSEDGTETAVGMLRATDFLFQDPAKKAEIEAFRDRIVGSPLGMLVGKVPLVAFSFSRNVAYSGNQVKYTPIEEYEKGMDEIGWDVEYFFAREPDVLVDTKGNPVDITGFDRKAFRQGAVYMRVKKRGSKQEHTIQVVNEGNGVYKESEYRKGEFKKTAQTHLRVRSEPLISKRVITNTKVLTAPGETVIRETPAAETSVTDTTLSPSNETFDTSDNKDLWIITYGKEGDKFKLSDGTEILILESGENHSIVRKSKDNFYTVEEYRQQEDGTVEVINGVNDNVTADQYEKPSRTVLFDIYQKMRNGLPLSSREYNIAVRHADKIGRIDTKVGTTTANVSTEPIDGIKQSLIEMGHDGEAIFGSLLQAYVESVIVRQPIEDWATLLEKAGLTQLQRQALQDVVNPALSGLVWAFVTQADAIWGFRKNKGYQNLVSDMQQDLRDLNQRTQGLNESKTPFKKVQEVRDEIVGKLRKAINKIGVDFTDEKVFKYLPEVDFKQAVQTVVEAMTPTRLIQGIKELQSKLAQFEIGITLGGIIKIKGLNLKSKGRRPQYVTDFDNIYTDILMLSETEELLDTTIVRNEQDGLFVQVQNNNRRVTPEILTLQKRFLDLFGLDIDASYFQAYKKVNGSFRGLHRRLYAEESRMDREDIPNSFGYIENETREDVRNKAKDRTGKVLSTNKGLKIVKSTEYYIRVDGWVYRNVMNISDTKAAYVRDSEVLSQEDVRAKMLAANIRPERKKNLDSQLNESLGDKTKLEQLKDDLSCGL